MAPTATTAFGALALSSLPCHILARRSDATQAVLAIIGVLVFVFFLTGLIVYTVYYSSRPANRSVIEDRSEIGLSDIEMVRPSMVRSRENVPDLAPASVSPGVRTTAAATTPVVLTTTPAPARAPATATATAPDTAPTTASGPAQNAQQGSSSNGGSFHDVPLD